MGIASTSTATPDMFDQVMELAERFSGNTSDPGFMDELRLMLETVGGERAADRDFEKEKYHRSLSMGGGRNSMGDVAAMTGALFGPRKSGTARRSAGRARNIVREEIAMGRKAKRLGLEARQENETWKDYQVRVGADTPDALKAQSQKKKAGLASEGKPWSIELTDKLNNDPMPGGPHGSSFKTSIGGQWGQDAQGEPDAGQPTSNSGALVPSQMVDRPPATPPPSHQDRWQSTLDRIRAEPWAAGLSEEQLAKLAQTDVEGLVNPVSLFGG